MANILVIDDNDTMREGMSTIIHKMGHTVFTAKNGREGIKIFSENLIDVVLTDLKMDGLDGIEVLKQLKEESPETVVLIVTAYGTIETAVTAMKYGAFDFITKPFPPEVLKMKVNQALEVQRLNEENQKLLNENLYFREEDNRRYNFNEMVGHSQVMQDIFKTIQKVAKSDSTVMIYGESGTGKELVARALHYHSHRKNGPFVKVNCGALAEGVLESELFGHERGSFTSAIRKRIGRFELADKGTILLDEVGELNPEIQLKLLRVLQEREFERVGGTQTIKVDVRVICSTNKNLQEEIEKGRFREDLYYRLHIIPITLPPLRERKEDIPELVHHFLKKLKNRTRKEVKGIEDEAMKLLINYSWRGNVRELENMIEQVIVFCDGDIIKASDLPFYIRNNNVFKENYNISSETGTLNEVLENVERQMIEAAYKNAKGVKTEMARMLGIKTSALYYKLEKYKIGVNEDKEDNYELH